MGIPRGLRAKPYSKCSLCSLNFVSGPVLVSGGPDSERREASGLSFWLYTNGYLCPTSGVGGVLFVGLSLIDKAYLWK